MNRKRSSAALLSVVLLGFLSLGAKRSFFSFGKEENLGVIKKGDIIQKVTAAGNIVPNRRTTITAPYNGYVQKLHVTLGQKVKAGDPIVSLVQSLRQIGEPIFPLRAPFPGTVVQLPRTEGEYVEMTGDQKTIVRIDDLSKLYILTEVPESNVSTLQTGMEVLIRPNSGTTRDYPGVIREISLAAKEKQGWGRPGERVNFDVRVEILEWDDFVRPGMSALVDIITSKKNQVLVLPHEYVERSNGDYFVTSKSGQKKKVEVGTSNETLFEIKSGVTENEEVKLVDFYSSAPNDPSSVTP